MLLLSSIFFTIKFFIISIGLVLHESVLFKKWKDRNFVPIPQQIQEILEDSRSSHDEDDHRWIIITGANSGIGLETTKFLLSVNKNVIMACRSISKANEAIETDIEQYKKENQHIKKWGKVKVMPLDLTSFASVKEFVNQILNQKLSISSLLCNAGIFATPFALTRDGFEAQVQSNFLSHQLLIQLLVEQYFSKISDPVRIAIVSTDTYFIFNRRDILSYADKVLGWNSSKPHSEMERHNNRYKTYCFSKLCQLVTFKYYNETVIRPNYEHIKMSALHPGTVATNITTNLNSTLRFLYELLFSKYLMKTPEEGSLANVFCMLSPHFEGGKFYDSFLGETSIEDLNFKEANPFYEKLQSVIQSLSE